jgi:hypothetical protein
VRTLKLTTHLPDWMKINVTSSFVSSVPASVQLVDYTLQSCAFVHHFGADLEFLVSAVTKVGLEERVGAHLVKYALDLVEFLL